MAKKSKDEAPNPHNVSNRDIIQRLNFLYQAGVYMNTISPPTSEHSIKQTKKRRTVKKATTRDLAKAYISCMKAVGQKTTVKLDPAVKRTICRGCDMVLVPGSTASVRVKKSTSHGHAMVYTCPSCRTWRRIPAPPTLSADVPMDTESLIGSVTDPLAPNSDLAGVSAMDVTAEEVTAEQGSRTDGRTQSSGVGHVKLKKRAIPRRPPLFVRDVGHVVFCGNERLDIAGGDGIYIT